MSEITLSIVEYNELMRASTKLDCLEAFGVDNWSGYDEALEPMRKEEKLSDLEDAFMSDLDDIMSEAEVGFPAGFEAGSSISWSSSDVTTILEKYVEAHSRISRDA